MFSAAGEAGSLLNAHFTPGRPPLVVAGGLLQQCIGETTQPTPLLSQKGGLQHCRLGMIILARNVERHPHWGDVWMTTLSENGDMGQIGKTSQLSFLTRGPLARKLPLLSSHPMWFFKEYSCTKASLHSLQDNDHSITLLLQTAHRLGLLAPTKKERQDLCLMPTNGAFCLQQRSKQSWSNFTFELFHGKTGSLPYTNKRGPAECRSAEARRLCLIAHCCKQNSNLLLPLGGKEGKQVDKSGAKQCVMTQVGNQRNSFFPL